MLTEEKRNVYFNNRDLILDRGHHLRIHQLLNAPEAKEIPVWLQPADIQGQRVSALRFGDPRVQASSRQSNLPAAFLHSKVRTYFTLQVEFARYANYYPQP